MPTPIGSSEISVCESEKLNSRTSIFAIKPITYSTTIVPNETSNGIQKDLFTTSPPNLFSGMSVCFYYDN